MRVEPSPQNFSNSGGRVSNSSISDSLKSQASSNMTSTSRPREWGKRKRLVTSKRQRVAVAPSKRFRGTHSQPLQPSDRSSTESDNSEDKKSSVHQQVAVAYADSTDVAANDMNDVANGHQKTVIGTKAKNDGPKLGYPTPLEVKNSRVVHQAHGDLLQKNRYDLVNMTAAMEPTGVRTADDGATTCSEKTRKNTSLTVVPTRPRYETGAMIVKEQDAKAVLKSNVINTEFGQSRDESLIDLELLKVERDLEAGDETWGLNVAKARFQAMLDDLWLSEESVEVADDPIVKLCDSENRSVDETRFFKTRLRDTISIVDALLCKPPRGQTCSRDCKVIRAQMCNEFTPCINPTCRVWHEAEAHNDNCPNEQCEFKTRVHLRETLRIIEHKRQEIADARAALQVANAAFFSPTRHSNKEETGEAAALEQVEQHWHRHEFRSSQRIPRLCLAFTLPKATDATERESMQQPALQLDHRLA